jgi:hypothetical protein
MGDDKASLGAIAAAGAALISGIGALTLTGTIGRVQRNNGGVFALGLGIVVFGAALWVAASVISPDARSWTIRGRNIGVRPAFQILGVAFSLVGLIVALSGAIATADDTEQPAVKLRLDDDGKGVTGSATVANLSSEDRLTVNVDGLMRTPNNEYDATNLYQAFVGPDSDGKASSDVAVPMPANRFDAIGIRAWTEEKPADCGDYADKAKGTTGGTGCVIIQLKL